MLQDLNISCNDSGFVICDALFLAELLDKAMDNGKIVARNHGEKMVLNLVL